MNRNSPPRAAFWAIVVNSSEDMALNLVDSNAQRGMIGGVAYTEMRCLITLIRSAPRRGDLSGRKTGIDAVLVGVFCVELVKLWRVRACSWFIFLGTKGMGDPFRLGIGDFRVIYAVVAGIVYITDIFHRG